ncbi:response regulator [Tundrisphaera lichenicola]|uniref:response regulator n=1 Tax=Tundrisphaera lichenicola TaxID=2029860 RepID=UPI003EB6C968
MPTALIVEDEPEANQLLSMLVQLRGFQTDSAFSGGQALEMVDPVRHDLVFLDLMLPDISGYDICRVLKESRSTCTIPVVMVTARLAEENRRQGFFTGASDYVSKPYTPEQIFEAMEQANDWRQEIARSSSEGQVALEARNEVANYRAICKLRTLLLERTRVSEDMARRIGQVLIDLTSRAIEWGSRKATGTVASIHYRWDQDEVEFVVADESGWFEAFPPRKLEGLAGLIAKGQFDKISFNEETRRLVLTSLTPSET